jgi:hypothetical protein
MTLPAYDLLMMAYPDYGLFIRPPAPSRNGVRKGASSLSRGKAQGPATSAQRRHKSIRAPNATSAYDVAWSPIETRIHVYDQLCRFDSSHRAVFGDLASRDRPACIIPRAGTIGYSDHHPAHLIDVVVERGHGIVAPSSSPPYCFAPQSDPAALVSKTPLATNEPVEIRRPSTAERFGMIGAVRNHPRHLSPLVGLMPGTAVKPLLRGCIALQSLDSSPGLGRPMRGVLLFEHRNGLTLSEFGPLTRPFVGHDITSAASADASR